MAHDLAKLTDTSYKAPTNKENTGGLRDEELLGFSDKPMESARAVGPIRTARVLTPVRDYKRSTYHSRAM
jgi:hypothetical protein